MSFFSRPLGNNAEQLREQARQLHQAGRLQEAYDLLQQAMSVATQHRDKKAEAWVHHSIGLLIRDAEQVSDSIQHFIQAIKLAQQIGDDFLSTQDYGNLGVSYRMLGNLDEAEQCQQISLDFAQRTNNPVQLASALHNLAIVYSQQGKIDKAISLYRRRMQIAEQLEDWHGVANSTLMLGQALLEIGAVDEANELTWNFLHRHGNTPLPGDLAERLFLLNIECSQARKQSRAYRPQPAADSSTRALPNRLPQPPSIAARIPTANSATHKDQARAFVQAATKRINDGDLAGGIRQLQSALEIARAGQLVQEEISILCLVTDAYGRTSASSKVLEYGNLALKLMRSHNHRDKEAGLLNLIGKGLARAGQMEAALTYFEQSAEVAEQQQDFYTFGAALTNGGHTYNELGRPADALKQLSDALTIVQKINDREGEMNILGSIGISYRILKRPRDAAQAIFQQLEIAEELEDVGAAAAANYNLANVYGDVGQYKEAIARAEQAAALFAYVGDVSHQQQALGIAHAYRAEL